MLRLTSVITLFLTLLISSAQAQPANWVLLGQQRVGFGVDRDVINVGQSEDWFRDRAFRALRFAAERNDVYMISIRLVYLNGYTEDMRIDRMIPQGGQIAVNLPGQRSYLRQIEMTYRARPDFRGEAVVRVFGDQVRMAGPPVGPGGGVWTELGCQQVNLFGADRDSIRVGRQEGRFKAIQLFARGAAVEMLDLKVIYADGPPDDLPVRSIIRSGERTRPLDLKGWERAITRIDMVYRTAGQNPTNIIGPQGIRTATVCVEGLR